MPFAPAVQQWQTRRRNGGTTRADAADGATAIKNQKFFLRERSDTAVLICVMRPHVVPSAVVLLRPLVLPQYCPLLSCCRRSCCGRSWCGCLCCGRLCCFHPPSYLWPSCYGRPCCHKHYSSRLAAAARAAAARAAAGRRPVRGRPAVDAHVAATLSIVAHAAAARGATVIVVAARAEAVRRPRAAAGRTPSAATDAGRPLRLTAVPRNETAAACLH